jgi:outer membrane immunogenic protein
MLWVKSYWSVVMKRIFIGIAAIASLTTGAFAADLAPRPYTKAPVYVDPGYNWTGFYVGGNIGYSWGRSSDTSTLTNAAGTVLLTTADKSNLNGVVGGGQIGYNWQMQSWVWGLEADIQGTGEQGSRAFGFTPLAGPGIGNFAPAVLIPFVLSQKIDWFGTVRGRAGVLVSPKVLLYVTGGLAYGQVNSSETIGTAVPSAFSNSITNVGWTVGAGIEGAIGGNWTAKLEYLYVDLGTVSSAYTLPSTNVISYSSRVTDNVLRVGLNYKFGGPVVAKY